MKKQLSAALVAFLSIAAQATGDRVECTNGGPPQYVGTRQWGVFTKFEDACQMQATASPRTNWQVVNGYCLLSTTDGTALGIWMTPIVDVCKKTSTQPVTLTSQAR